MKIAKKSIFFITLGVASIMALIPFYVILSMATHSTPEIYKAEIIYLGNQLSNNMQTIIQGGFLKYYWNTFYIAMASACLCIAISAMAAYALSIYRFKWRSFCKTFIVTSMMIPGQIGLIGYAIEMRKLGLVNTHAPLILIWGASAYGVFFIMQYFQNSLPAELIESARIDGSGEVRTFLSIAIPLSKPALGTLFMLIFLWSWNNFLMPSIMLTESDKFTLPLGIQTLATAYTQDMGARAAALSIAILPMLIIFAFGSKYFIQGIAAGAVKG